MYFYIHKINEDENEQAQLLEMCRNAGVFVRNGKSIDGIDTQHILIEKLQASPATFLFNRYV